MSTRSNIGIINSDGAVETVYCHFDGYPSHNGNILMEHYSNTDKVRELISHGSISILAEKIGEKHDFNSHCQNEQANDWCLFYHRDRGEQLRCFLEEYDEEEQNINAAISKMQEYLYLWDEHDNAWYYIDGHVSYPKLEMLTPEICKKK